MTNSELKANVVAFQNKISNEGYPDIYFERYQNYDGSWGYVCKHKDYTEPCYYTGTFGTIEEKLTKLIDMFDCYVRNNEKYM